MKISILVAMGENRVIGIENRLPWKLPADLKRFKELTLGHPVIMGRKTFESIGRALSGRTNIVITKNPDFRREECIIAKSPEEALEIAKTRDTDEVFVIGGARIYEEMLSYADRLYITLVQGAFEGDAFFPEIDPRAWKEISREDYPKDLKNPYPFSFLVLDRVTSRGRRRK